MKRISILLIAFIFLLKLPVKAGEGMWILTLLHKNYKEMKKQGFKLTPEDVYSVNNASLKDAVVVFGGFCTGEIVSNDGLIFTNHHCGYEAIQEHSSVEHNYLKNGFAAPTLKDELANPSLFVSFLVKMEDVSKRVNKVLDTVKTEEARFAAFGKLRKEIVEEYTKGTTYRGELKSFFHNNQYFVVLYQNYNDIRLVAAPPESIGKFGFDTDNWVYPRHTGDFSVFRVYMSPDGKPASYSPDNIPLKPKKFLEISGKGYKEGDYAMIMGFPGSTDRYMTSWGVEELLQVEHPNRIKIRGLRQDILMKDMKADENVRIQYASKFARSSNYWKYSIGQKRGLENLNVLAKKQATEKEFTTWVNAKKKRINKYGEALDLIKKAYQGRRPYQNAQQYMVETQIRGIELPYFAFNLVKRHSKDAKEYAEKFFKDYHVSTDQKVAKAMIKLYRNDIAPEYYPAYFKSIKENYNNDIDKFVDELYANSIFASKEKLMKNIDNMDTLQNDIAFKTISDIIAKYRELAQKAQESNINLEKGRRLYLKGLMEMQPKHNFYPDANFTMRLTYGHVKSYKHKDGVTYDYFTTLKGVMEKYKPGDYEFDVDPRLLKIYKDKDYGDYVDADGTMHVCFLSTNDITGGNSGSPIMDANGRLMGLAFDGNWEAMSGDIAFEPDLQRTINVDVRYVLLVLDKVLGAKRLINEVKIVK